MLRLNGYKNLLMKKIGRHTLYIELLSVNRYGIKHDISLIEPSVYRKIHS